MLQIFNNPNDAPISMVYVSPSLDTHGLKNPSLRMYYLNSNTWELDDYEQYYFDLKSKFIG